MATHPIPHTATPSEEPVLNHEEWWQLFDRLRLSQQEAYDGHGGPVAFVQVERNLSAPLD
jgi:hypothetical protein